MLNFKGNLVFSHVNEIPWNNPATGQSFTIREVICYANTGFQSGPSSYVYHLKLNKNAQALLPQIMSWPKDTSVSVAGLVTSVDKPTKVDPTKTWNQVGLLVSEIAPAMVSQPAAVAAQMAPGGQVAVQQDAALNPALQQHAQQLTQPAPVYVPPTNELDHIPF